MRTTEDATESPEQVFRSHIASFNARDLDSLLTGFAQDALWVTGQDTVQGTAELSAFFGAALSELAPSLTVTSLVIDGDCAAAEMRERFTVDGTVKESLIAGFYRINSGRIVSAKIYREGSADAH